MGYLFFLSKNPELKWFLILSSFCLIDLLYSHFLLEVRNNIMLELKEEGPRIHSMIELFCQPEQSFWSIITMPQTRCVSQKPYCNPMLRILSNRHFFFFLSKLLTFQKKCWLSKFFFFQKPDKPNQIVFILFW